jgi:hypothetical protein
MKIEERMLRNNQEDEIEIGLALENFYNSDAGAIFRALVNSITIDQYANPQDNTTSADRRLGRAEGLHLLIEDIELAIQRMKSYTAEIKEDQRLGGSDVSER